MLGTVSRGRRRPAQAVLIEVLARICKSSSGLCISATIVICVNIDSRDLESDLPDLCFCTATSAFGMSFATPLHLDHGPNAVESTCAVSRKEQIQAERTNTTGSVFLGMVFICDCLERQNGK